VFPALAMKQQNSSYEKHCLAQSFDFRNQYFFPGLKDAKKKVCPSGGQKLCLYINTDIKLIFFEQTHVEF